MINTGADIAGLSKKWNGPTYVPPFGDTTGCGYVFFIFICADYIAPSHSMRTNL